MVDRAAIFAELTKRNAVRREAKLPLLDLHDEFEHAVSLALWDEAWEQHADELSRIRAEVPSTAISSQPPVACFSALDSWSEPPFFWSNMGSIHRRRAIRSGMVKIPTVRRK
jgi:hypothetical protein